MDYFDKTYHPPGTAPGTLTSDEAVTAGALSIRLIDFNNSDYLEKELSSTHECQPYLDKDSVTWIHLQGSDSTLADTLKNIGEIFTLHPLALEDIINKGQRPKVEEYDGLLFLILSMPYLHDGMPMIEQVSLFLGENYLISFHSGEHDPFDPLRLRLQKKSGRIRNQKADYLLYCIVDLIIDQGYPVLESLGEKVEALEEVMLDLNTKQSTLTNVHELRRELLLLRRNLWPQREVINDLLRSENALIRDGTLVYLRDCYDHSTQILELTENYREMATSLIDLYLVVPEINLTHCLI